MSASSQQVKKRLLRDYMTLMRDPPSGISASPREGDILTWDAIIFGPEATCFAGGIFYLELVFSNDYPQKAPTVKFTSKMFHPNIYAGGHICLDILQDQWSSTYDVSGILTSIQSLLVDPNPNSPANTDAAAMYIENRGQYVRTVQRLIEDQVALESDDE
ncbi:hypothetical protein XU18_2158 [Perkinsela sp. CCAP 1560/4]|nr:hypothetical protein XU18_2158 [Perkinsela sp. CCAP 1560/4]|eukprot:KNH07113.1 hypothetical protein XU18_2158 [Perkinsela sp. CCAP 1560/4]